MSDANSSSGEERPEEPDEPESNHDDNHDDDHDDGGEDMGAGMDSVGDPDMPVELPDCIQPPTDPTQLEAARQLYVQYCSACHGQDAQGNEPLGPELLEEVAEESDEELLEVIIEGDDEMPPIPVTTQQASEIIGWLVWAAEQAGEDSSERCESEEGH